MNRLISSFAFLLFCFACHAQDLIITKKGDEISAKVLEVTPTEIKYKRTDNPDGPVYTADKSTVFMIKYENGTKEIIETTATPSNEATQAKSTVYFLRKTGYAGSMAGYQVFIDDQVICKLNNSKYVVREIPAGKHIFSVQFYGATSKAKAEKLEINMEAGKTYYVQVTQGGKVTTGDTWCEQMEEPAALELLKKLNIDEDCN